MKRSTRVGKWLTAMLAAISLTAAAQEAMPGANLASLLDYARTHNPEYAAMRFEAEAAGERVQPAGALPDPTLRVEMMDITNNGRDAGPSLLPSRVGSTRYTVIQPLPFWGKRDLKRDAASAEAESARATASATWIDLAARVKAAYAEYYRANVSVKLTREILDLVARIAQVAQARYASGLVPQQDVLRAQIEQTAMTSELIGMETEQHHLHSRINALLRRPSDAPLADPIALRPVPTQLTMSALQQRLKEKNPQLAAQTLKVTAAEKSSALVLRNRYPDFALGVFPTQMGRGVSEWGVMLEVNIPLQQNSRRSQEHEALAMVSAAEARRDALQTQLSSELALNIVAIDAARRTETLTRLSLNPQSEINYKAALAAYENGKVDFATLLEAQRQIRRSRLEELKAQVEAQLRLADIERLIGEDL